MHRCSFSLYPSFIIVIFPMYMNLQQHRNRTSSIFALAYIWCFIVAVLLVFLLLLDKQRLGSAEYFISGACHYLKLQFVKFTSMRSLRHDFKSSIYFHLKLSPGFQIFKFLINLFEFLPSFSHSHCTFRTTLSIQDESKIFFFYNIFCWLVPWNILYLLCSLFMLLLLVFVQLIFSCFDSPH